jgi:thiaminase/transcriptional activator TenA
VIVKMRELMNKSGDKSNSGAFSDQMRASALKTWNAAIGTGKIADRVFERYLRIEYGFVDCAAVVLGYAVAKAPSFKERRRLAFGLYGLVTDQENFFAAAFEQMGTSPALRVGLPPNELSGPLHEVFLGAAKNEGYEEIIACILAAEWMYLTWCSTAHRMPSSRPYLRNWVALHAGGAFADHVAWIRSEVDTCAPQLSASRQKRLHKLFEETLLAEDLFHNAPYAV